MKIKLAHTFEDIISLENLCLAWQEFIVGKKDKLDVQAFAREFMDRIVSLHEDLVTRRYRHGSYQSFFITDPKLRHIHKACVRDRLIHHAIYRVLYPFFDSIFISDTFSCRKEKGTHRALNRFRSFAYQVSKNNTRTCWVLKGDIQKCFASIDQDILLSLLAERIQDKNTMWLLTELIRSFSSGTGGIGLPLGNLTSQLFINIYLNEFDQFIKHKLKCKSYIRYADDFVIFSPYKDRLISLIQQIKQFLQDELHLTLHPQKIVLKTIASGVDFLGWVHFINHRVLRTATRRRIVKKLQEHPANKTLQSYLGLLSHGNSFKLQQELLQDYCLWHDSYKAEPEKEIFNSMIPARDV